MRMELINFSFRPKLRRAANISYQEQQNENEESFNDENVVNSNSTPIPMSSIRPRSVVSKVKDDQKKWKRNVELQRSTVYDRHSMLN